MRPFSIIVLLLLVSFYAKSQRVALVLSGGGAKGLAHAGVIKALEENDIPIDYVCGTSMGAIVGAYYASGYSASEIYNLSTSSNLQKLVRNIPKDKFESLFQNEEVDPSWLKLKLSIDSSFSASFGTGFLEDYFLNFELARSFAKATKISLGNFDKLFVPYRAVASEIFTEQEVVLKSGNLYEAARASMAVPFVYRPFEIDNKLLFDGGIYNNFPAEVARKEFKPDIIIGVNVASKKLKEYPYEADDDLVAESILFAILDKTDSTELENDDIFIDVDLDQYHSLEFRDAKNIAEVGYETTMKKMSLIQSKISSRRSQKELQKQRGEFFSGSSAIVFDSLVINGFTKNQFRFVRGRFNACRPLTIDDIEEGYNKIVSEDYFANVVPSYSLGQRNFFLLSGNPNPKLNGKIGGTLTSRNNSQFYIGFDLKRLRRVLTHYSLGAYTGRFYQSVNASTTVQFPGRLNLSIKPQFIYNRWNFAGTADFLSKTKSPEILDRVDYSYGLHVRFPITKKLYLNIHGSYFHNEDRFSNDNTLSSFDELDLLKLNGFKSQVRVFQSSLNFPQYPFVGKRLNLYFNYIKANADYSAGGTSLIGSYDASGMGWVKFGMEFEKYWKLGHGFSLGLGSSGSYSNQPILGTKRSTILNQTEFNPLQDTRTLILENFRGRKFMTARISNVFLISENFQLRLEGHSILHLERLQGPMANSGIYVSENWVKFAGMASAVYHSIIGPISLGINYYDQSGHQWGGLLHIGYLLFNKKSLD
ncbi:MAG: patatin-like phospholipase family protein [Cyclobacteriaceae bacterium]